MTEIKNKKLWVGMSTSTWLALGVVLGGAFDKVGLGIAMALLLSTIFGAAKYRK